MVFGGEGMTIFLESPPARNGCALPVHQQADLAANFVGQEADVPASSGVTSTSAGRAGDRGFSSLRV